MAADQRIARLPRPPAVVGHVQAVIGAEWNRGVGTAGLSPARFLGQRRLDQGDHVDVAIEMTAFVEGAWGRVALTTDVPQVEEVHAIPEPTHHARKVVVTARAERAGAERDAVRRIVDRLHHAGIVVLGRHDARQAEERERRIVGMTADADTCLRSDRHHLFEEVDEILPQPLRSDRAIRCEMLAQLVEREAFCRARQAEDDVPRQRAPARFVHRGEAARCLLRDVFGIVGIGACKDVDVEGGEVREVEPHAGGARVQRPVEVRAGPVQDRHEIVADDLYAGRGEVAEALLPGGDMAAPIPALALDVLGHRQALDHGPVEAGGRVVCTGDQALPCGDLLRRPDRAGRQVVQRGDDACCTGLPHVIDRHRVGWSEPAPAFLHSAKPSSTAPPRWQNGTSSARGGASSACGCRC